LASPSRTSRCALQVFLDVIERITSGIPSLLASCFAIHQPGFCSCALDDRLPQRHPSRAEPQPICSSSWRL